MRQVKPVGVTERIQSLDVIRGFALLGILMVNMALFKMPFFTQGMAAAGSSLSAWFIQLVFTGKFYAIFSFLFGLGFYIFMERASAKGAAVVPLYLRRTGALLIMGIIHLTLWSGDILFTYAIGGFILLAFRKLSLKALKTWIIIMFILAILMMGFIGLLQGGLSYVMGDEYQEMITDLTNRAYEVYGSGSFGQLLQFRLAYEIPDVLIGILFWIPSVLAYFLCGLYIGKKGVFNNPETHLPLIRKIRTRGYALGGIATVLYILVATGGVHEALKPALLQVTNHIAAIFLFSAYLSTIVLALRLEFWQRILIPLAAAGRMALSNYLTQTLFCLLIFNGYGLGLFGLVSAPLGILLTVTIFIVQVMWSNLWMKSYNYGPMEGLWRSFTYKIKPQWRITDLKKAG